MKWRFKKVLPHMSGQVIDVGCGTNELIRSYTGEGLGVDVWQWGDVDLIVENSAHLPFEDMSFDTVTCIAALNHIPNRNKFLQEVLRLLRPEGKFVMTMIPPRIGRLWHLIRRPWDADQKERIAEKGETWGIRPAEVRQMLIGVGFAVEHEEAFMLGLNRLYVARKCPPLSRL